MTYTPTTPPPPRTLVAAADYADALTVARRVRLGVCLGLWFVLGTGLTLFFLLRYTAATRALLTAPADHVAGRAVLEYLVGLLDYAALILPLVLIGATAATLGVQVAARTVGAGPTTSSLAWALLLAVMLFPWQAVLNNPSINADDRADAIGMKVPGVVYTWAEVSHPSQGATFAEVTGRVPGAPPSEGPVPPTGVERAAAVLHWARYVGFPALAMVIVGLAHAAGERGLRRSFGADPAAVDPAAGEPVLSDVNPRL